VADLVAAAYDFGQWPQSLTIQSSRAVDVICQAAQFTPEQKIDKIVGAATPMGKYKIELLMWALLVSFDC
jgi:hypothetical protein